MNEAKKVIENTVFDFTDAMQAPLITFETTWADCIPERIKKIIPMARLKGLMKGHTVASYPEAVAYLYTRSCVAPMTSEWSNIYCYISCMVCHYYFKETHFKDLDVKELTSYEKQLLEKLRREIYNKRRKVLKERLKQSNASKKSEHRVTLP